MLRELGQVVKSNSIVVPGVICAFYLSLISNPFQLTDVVPTRAVDEGVVNALPDVRDVAQAIADYARRMGDN